MMQNIVLQKLKEREKELNCLYKVREIVRDDTANLESKFTRIIRAIPPGYQYPTVCVVRIRYDDMEFTSDDFVETEWIQSAELIVDNNIVGRIEVFYTQLIRKLHYSQFLPEEQKLLNTIADLLSTHLFYIKLQSTIQYLEESAKETEPEENESGKLLSPEYNEHWKWRQHMIEIMVDKLDQDRFGLLNLYLIGSTLSGKAGPSSDIDLIARFRGTDEQLVRFKCWIEGWSHCLAEINFSKTGYHSDNGLIDLHILTDKDIQDKNSYAIMLNSKENFAKALL